MESGGSLGILRVFIFGTTRSIVRYYDYICLEVRKEVRYENYL